MTGYNLYELQIHENPHSQLHKSIEFYDFRVAETALRALNRNDATMKKLKVEPSNFTDSERWFSQFYFGFCSVLSNSHRYEAEFEQIDTFL